MQHQEAPSMTSSLLDWVQLKAWTGYVWWKEMHLWTANSFVQDQLFLFQETAFQPGEKSYCYCCCQHWLQLFLMFLCLDSCYFLFFPVLASKMGRSLYSLKLFILKSFVSAYHFIKYLYLAAFKKSWNTFLSFTLTIEVNLNGLCAVASYLLSELLTLIGIKHATYFRYYNFSVKCTYK